MVSITFPTISMLIVVESFPRLFEDRSEAVFGFLEIDHVPDRFEIVDLNILVLEVESMFPDVDTKDRYMVGQRVLVGGSDNFQSSSVGIPRKPTPTATLDCSGLGDEIFEETFNGVEILEDLFFEHSTVEFTTTLGYRRQVLPEKRMINVTATVELQSTLKDNFFFGVLSFGIRFFCGIEAVNISLMMLGMMELHDFFAYVRFQSIISIGKRWEGVECSCTCCKMERHYISGAQGVARKGEHVFANKVAK